MLINGVVLANRSEDWGQGVEDNLYQKLKRARGERREEGGGEREEKKPAKAK